jgi:iron complex transport system substrate-binding protein
MLRPKARATPLAIFGAAVVLTLIGCSSGSGQTGAPGQSTGSSSGAQPSGAQAATGFPVTISDCGRTLTFDAAPKRVVILNPMIAVDMIGLGLADRIVGQATTAYFPSPPQIAKVPVLSASDTPPTTETLLGARPDLVISDLVYRLTPPRGASMSQLQQAGAQSYVDTAGCSATYTGGTIEDELTDLENLGRIFGVEARAAALEARLKAELAGVQRRVSGQPKVSVFEGTLYGSDYYPVSSLGLDELTAAGGASIFPDVKDANASISKEQITARSPQAIVDQLSGPYDDKLTQFGDKQRQEAITALKTAFPTTGAVKNNRIYFVSYSPSGEPGSAIETVTTVQQLAKYLHPTAFDR